MPKDPKASFDDLAQTLLGRRVTYVGLFLNSLRMCVDRELGEATGFFLWFEPVWHLGSPNGILVGSRQAQTEEHDVRAELNLLVQKVLGKQIEGVSIETLTNDIDVRFSGGYWIRTFVSDPTDDESWYLRDCQSNFVITGSPRGLSLQERSAPSPERGE